jgi:mRNA-degrading endonuclease RelE of RelBE toxin-antitoxin system
MSSPNYDVITPDFCERQLKHLSKKYPSIRQDVDKLIAELETNPQMGTPLRNSCRKIRLAITSKGKGKSGGARVITHTIVINNIVYLLTIYDKSEQATITDKQILELVNLIDNP